MKQLMLLPILDSFFLVGGTALALQLGHRTSVDLDLFTLQPFNNSILPDTLAAEFNIIVESEQPNMIITNIEGIKVDFVKMGYPLLFPALSVEGVRMLDIRDIAPMKLKAIAQRGSKKDFLDIYFLLQHLPLETMISLFQQKFKMYEIFHIIKSLTYFEDAEQFADPDVFDKSVSWEKVKTLIQESVKKLN
ncbi:MAG: nucleotidyl transferase AbiEii/AbiGii toxin family protein [Chitinophagaceae bacterium]|nr:nucleotidyl transferase AbiEii/AbiGii toxin family protein [Chitinophagaceae bacterium]